MTVKVRPFAIEMLPFSGYGARLRRSLFGEFSPRLLWLPALGLAGCVAWMMVPGASDAEGQPAPVIGEAPNATWFDPVVTAIEANPATRAEAAARAGAPAEPVAAAKSPIDGLWIASQSWRRGGLGSKALVTFTVRNSNEFAVKDVEIACAFTRRDGSHLTDRKRMIHDTVNMKSQRTFARMHVGFVNVHADKAKCSLLAASRI